jgi:hypothetical protein
MKTSYGIFPHSLLKNIFLSILFSLAGYLGYSQVSFGAKSGMNIATTKDLIELPKNRIGWYVGGFVTIPVHKKFFWQTELLYSTKGHSVNQTNTPKTILKFNYLTVPVLLGYEIDHKTSIYFGPEFGYLLSAFFRYNNNASFDVLENYRPRFDLGLDIGLDYKIINKIGVEMRYNYGFEYIYYIDFADVEHKETKGANRVFQIGLNYIL